MTVRQLADYFSNRQMFRDPDQEVLFKLSPDSVDLESGERLEIRGSLVPQQGPACVALRKPKTRKFMFSLKFEANPVIEAESLQDAEDKASSMIQERFVMDTEGEADQSYVAQEPYFLEEVKE